MVCRSGALTEEFLSRMGDQGLPILKVIEP
jgi:hypothetical protein